MNFKKAVVLLIYIGGGILLGGFLGMALVMFLAFAWKRLTPPRTSDPELALIAVFWSAGAAVIGGILGGILGLVLGIKWVRRK